MFQVYYMAAERESLVQPWRREVAHTPSVPPSRVASPPSAVPRPPSPVECGDMPLKSWFSGA